MHSDVTCIPAYLPVTMATAENFAVEVFTNIENWLEDVGTLANNAGLPSKPVQLCRGLIFCSVKYAYKLQNKSMRLIAASRIQLYPRLIGLTPIITVNVGMNSMTKMYSDCIALC